MDRSAIDLKMMRRCVELSADGGAAPGAAILLRHLPRRRGRRRSDQSRRAGRRCHQACRDHCHIGGPEDSRPQRSVGLHDLFQRRAVPDVLVSDPRDPDRQGGLRHQFADDGRILQMECAGRQRNLQRHAGGVRRQAGGRRRPVLPRGCRGVAKVESGVLARHSLSRLPRRSGAGRRRCDAASPAHGAASVAAAPDIAVAGLRAKAPTAAVIRVQSDRRP